MMYELDASGQTPDDGGCLALWPANVDASTRLRIQNRSQTRLQVQVVKDDNGLLFIELPDFGDLTDETWVDPTCEVRLQSASPGASFTAIRMV